MNIMNYLYTFSNSSDTAEQEYSSSESIVYE